LCCRTINGPPIDGLRNQSAALQIALHIRPSGADLSGGEDAPKDSESKSFPHFQAMQSGEWQRVGGCLKDGLRAHAVGIIDVIRDEQTGIRVRAYAALVPLLFPRQQNQIGQNPVARNSTTPSRRIGPANRAFAPGRRFYFQRRFQFVDALKEFPTLPRRQSLHVLQHFIRAHGRKIARTGRAVQVRFWQLTTDD